MDQPVTAESGLPHHHTAALAAELHQPVVASNGSIPATTGSALRRCLPVVSALL